MEKKEKSSKSAMKELYAVDVNDLRTRVTALETVIAHLLELAKQDLSESYDG